MFEKGYMKNFTKYKNKLELQSKHPTFLEDQNWGSSQKSQKQSKNQYKVKHQTKNAKRFDLEQIKKELGLIQLKTSLPQETQNNKKVEKASISRKSSVKKQKGQLKQEEQKSFNTKNNKMSTKEEVIIEGNKDGLTDRINQLVRLRMEHENIINSLVKNKASHISTEQKSQKSIPSPVYKLQSHSSGYIKINHEQETLNPQKTDFQSGKFKKQKDSPPKLEVESRYLVSIKSKQSSFHQDKSRIKQNKFYQTEMQGFLGKGDKSYRRVFTEKQLAKSIDGQVQETPTMKELRIESNRQSKGKNSQRFSEKNNSVRQNKELNESNFEMQKHVNLLSSLDQFQPTNRQKTVRQDEISIKNKLYPSIIQFIQNNILNNSKFSKRFKPLQPEIHITYAGMNQTHQDNSFLVKGIKRMKQVNKDFEKVVCYLTESQVWQGVFRSEEKSVFDETNRALIKITEFHGLCFDSGNYKEVLLSEAKLSQEEKNLLIFNFQEESIIYCDISLLLLSRLINLQVNKTFPAMLHRLFGYQFEVFNIQRLESFMDCMDFIDRLREIHNKELKNEGGLVVENNNDGTFKRKYSLQQISEQEKSGLQDQQNLQDSEKSCDFQLFGLNKTNQYFQLITPSFFSQKNKIVSAIQIYEFRELMRHERYAKRLSQAYSKLSIINKKQLPVKSMKLRHFPNHFVVVSININEEGLYFLSVGQKIDELKKINHKNNKLRFRLCLISSVSKTILQCVTLERNQSYPVYLAKQQFEVFISAFESELPSDFIHRQIQSQEKKNQPDQSILNFIFYIQSHHIIAKSAEQLTKRELEMELRLKEEYQNYTSMIMEQFIDFSFLQKEITKFFTSIHQPNQNKHSHSKFIEEDKSLTKQIKNLKAGSCKKFEDFELKSQESYKFVSNENPQMKTSSSESRILRLSLDNQNTLEYQNMQKNHDLLVEDESNQRQFFTFQDLQIEPSRTLINILRVHLKSLDLYIDCIDTTFMGEDEVMNEEKQVSNIVEYSKQRVLCDVNHQKNSVNIRPSQINLIYLTKDSPISSITSQNKIHRKISHHQNHFNQFNFKIFRKQW